MNRLEAVIESVELENRFCYIGDTINLKIVLRNSGNLPISDRDKIYCKVAELEQIQNRQIGEVVQPQGNKRIDFQIQIPYNIQSNSEKDSFTLLFILQSNNNEIISNEKAIQIDIIKPLIQKQKIDMINLSRNQSQSIKYSIKNCGSIP